MGLADVRRHRRARTPSRRRGGRAHRRHPLGPAADPQGSWRSYLDAWPFADVAADDPLLDLVPDAADLGRHVVSLPTFGKWGPDLEAVTGPTPHLVLTGVATDCCVVSTALAAADAGATVTVVTDACAGSSPQNQRAALDVMALYPPQITLATTADLLGPVA